MKSSKYKVKYMRNKNIYPPESILDWFERNKIRSTKGHSHENKATQKQYEENYEKQKSSEKEAYNSTDEMS